MRIIVLLIISCLGIYGCSDSRKSSTKIDKPVPMSDTEIQKAIEKHLADNFGIPGATTTWYNNIKAIEVSGKDLRARTDLLPGDPKLSKICGAIYSWYAMEHRGMEIEKIRILAANGLQLVDQTIANEKCLP